MKIVISFTRWSQPLLSLNKFVVFAFCGLIYSSIYGAELKYQKLMLGTKDNLTPETSIILYMAYPDSLCGGSVGDFLRQTAREETLEFNFNNCGFQQDQVRLLLNGLASLGRGKIKDAVDYFQKIKKQKNLSPLLEYCIDLNELLVETLRGRLAYAKKQLIKLAKKHPEKDGAFKNLFVFFRGQNLYAADSLLENILNKFPHKIWAQIEKVSLVAEVATPLENEIFLKTRSNKKDSLFAIQIAYGIFLKKKGNFPEAISYLSQGLEGYPHSGEGWLVLADIYNEKKDYEWAEKSLHNAIHAGIYDPVYFEIMADLVWHRIYFKFKMIKKSQELYDDCVRAKGPMGCNPHYVNGVKKKAQLDIELYQKGLEHALVQGQSVRTLAKTLFIAYGAQGKKEAMGNLKQTFWFHFLAEDPGYKPKFGPTWPPENYFMRLRIPTSALAYNSDPINP